MDNDIQKNVLVDIYETEISHIKNDLYLDTDHKAKQYQYVSLEYRENEDESIGHLKVSITSQFEYSSPINPYSFGTITKFNLNNFVMDHPSKMTVLKDCCLNAYQAHKEKLIKELKFHEYRKLINEELNPETYQYQINTIFDTPEKSNKIITTK